MKQLFAVLLFLIAVTIHAQSITGAKFKSEILIDVNYKGTVDVYDSTGKIIRQLKDTNTDDCISLTIIGKNDSMYNVIASYCIEGVITKGWIKKNIPQLGIYSKTCGLPSSLNLYEKPEESSKILSTMNGGQTPFLQVKDFENNWLFVTGVVDNKKYEGWISPCMQCSNPYTTCCGQ